MMVEIMVVLTVVAMVVLAVERVETGMNRERLRQLEARMEILENAYRDLSAAFEHGEHKRGRDETPKHRSMWD